jgi:anti-anti-sigma factor
MALRFETDPDILLVRLSGRLDGTNAAEAEQALLGRIESGPTRVVLDMTELDYISSAGLRVVLLAAKRLRKAEGALSLCGMKAHIREVFEVSGFLTLFAVSDDVSGARAAVLAS